jgi:hypothetical protein
LPEHVGIMARDYRRQEENRGRALG